MTTKAHHILTLAALSAAAPCSRAQITSGNLATAGAPALTLSPTEQIIQDIKKPVSWLSWGADFRVRDEHFDNILTLNPNNPLHEQDYLRFRGRLWPALPLSRT